MQRQSIQLLVVSSRTIMISEGQQLLGVVSCEHECHRCKRLMAPAGGKGLGNFLLVVMKKRGSSRRPDVVAFMETVGRAVQLIDI